MASFYKCPNLGNCDQADQGKIISIAVGEPAKCPDCGAGLIPAKGGAKPPGVSFPSGSSLIGLGLVIVLLLLIAGAAWFFLKQENAAPPAAAVSEPPPAPQAANTLLRFQGSSTIGGKLLPALAAAFLQQEGYAKVRKIDGPKEDESFIVGERNGQAGQIEIRAHGSGDAFRCLKDGQCDIGMSSRKIKPEEVAALRGLGDLASNASEHVLALDGVAVIVHPSNPVKTLSLSQVADIFSGTLGSWASLSGQAGAIAVFARDDRSGTYDFFKEDVLAPRRKMLAANAQRFEDGQKLAAAVAANPAGIGFVGLNYVGTNKVLALSDAGVEPRKPSLLTIKTEDYRLSRRLYLYTAESPANIHVAKFIEFAVGADGQRIVESTGLVNLDPAPVAPGPAALDFNEDARGRSTRWRALTKGAAELATHIHFRVGGNDLDARANRDIGRISGLLSQPQYRDKKLILIGFADSSGNKAANCKLSQDRADKVRQELAPEGLAIEQAAGLCDEASVAPNDSPENREKNRRVEVWVR
jgi:phosphate transport system substrate-binding protein